MHQRQQIRQAIVAALEATPELSGRVFSTRLRSTQVEEMPVALVYALRETSSHRDLKRMLDRTVQAAIEIKASAPENADLADALDDLAEIVEDAMYADPELGGLVLGIELVETSIGLDGSGNAKDGNAILAFNIRYLTRRS